MWKRLRHPNIVAFIGVTRVPVQFVSEWMPNGTLTRYINTHPTADRICLVGRSCTVITPWLTEIFSRVIGYCGRSYVSPRKPHNTRGLERGKYFLPAVLQ